MLENSSFDKGILFLINASASTLRNQAKCAIFVDYLLVIDDIPRSMRKRVSEREFTQLLEWLFRDAYVHNAMLARAYQRVPPLAHLVMASTKGDTTLITIRSDAASNSQALINNVQDMNWHADLGLKVLVGGSQAMTLDFDQVFYPAYQDRLRSQPLFQEDMSSVSKA